MSTLISVHNSDGCVGRCDAKCYDATHPHCDCICGGKNHGAGKKQATENTRELADTWLKDYMEAKGLKDAKGEINKEIFQLQLFNDD
jgi:hypothetical protein